MYQFLKFGLIGDTNNFPEYAKHPCVCAVVRVPSFLLPALPLSVQSM